MENKEQWISLLEAIQHKHKNVGIINDLLHQMKTGKSQGPSPKQKAVVTKIYEESWYKDDIDRYFNTNKSPVKEEIIAKINHKTYINNIPAEVITYKDGGVIERNPIGFKINAISTPPTNRYTMDTSIENIKQSKLEKFDALFND